MQSRCLAAAAVAAVLAVSLAIGTSAKSVRPAAAPTAAEARAFIARAEADLARQGEYEAHVAWVQNTYIMDDTNWLTARANAEGTDMTVRYAKEAARFDHVQVDPVTRRKLYLLTHQLVLPASSRPGASQELADIRARLTADYSTAKFEYKGKTLTLDDLEDILRTSRDPNETKTLWEGWRTVSSPQMVKDYQRLVVLANEGSRELGFADTGALWRSGYDMPADDFAKKTDAVWHQVEPLYNKLHCYVRAKLSEKYGPAVQPATGPIRADLLGNMWAQEWGNIYDIVAPTGGPGLGYDLTKQLVDHGYDAMKIVHTADNWYQSIGLPPEPPTFWTRSMFTRPRDRDVVCHASAWDVDGKNDLRVKACFTVTADDFYTAHHELGHNMYQRAYQNQPYLFRDGANDGFHEAIGDFAGLNALTPDYLKQLGLIDTVPPAEADIPYLLRMALDKVAFLPFGLLVDKWRWGVFSGKITPEHYNDAWWDLVKEYQGLTPPGPRPANAFDPGAKFHVANNTPYMRYFLAAIYEFQFYRAACRQAGWKGPLNRCSIYNNKTVGAKFQEMLRLGQSKPWPEALATFTGEHDIDATAITDYFAPLSGWLDKQNQGRVCTRS
ncbi:MAG: M2 family metallopeptidase [Alphaproteobacteria bacterium]|nr:M2 family metallopeptidase [Alphaproteobacteria bacterium]MBL6937693.1 M2 family metallopeptidase [Alphaproteobacteria bacterium]MBL7099031.1 M2 family metallopeptidase [Alphaproteobacteria bacterium]